MNKKERNIRNAKINDQTAIKYLKYLRIASIVSVCLVSVYVLYLTFVTGKSFNELIVGNLSVVIGFIVAAGSLITFYASKHVEKSIEELAHLELARWILMVIAISSFVMLNFINAAFAIIALFKIFKWKDKFSLKGSFKELKRDNDLSSLIIIFVVYIILFVLQCVIGSYMEV